MPPNIEIYIGSPIQVQSEREFLDRLSSDLKARDESALIFANFHTQVNPRQIDFLVVTSTCACHVELKHFGSPVRGTINGTWVLVQPDGTQKPIDANPYDQALHAKFALSDEVEEIWITKPDLLPKKEGRTKKFYEMIQSVVCIFPSILDGSNVPEGDYKVWIMSNYENFLEFLLATTRHPPWNKQHWLSVAKHLGLKLQTESSQLVDTSIAEAGELVCQYKKRFIDFYQALLPLVPTTLGTETEPVLTDSIKHILLEKKHAQLLGRSGCGKTHLAQHIALESIAGGQIPIFVRAKYYDENLERLLDYSIEPFHAGTTKELLSLCAKAGKSVALIIDGFNECAHTFQDTLLRELQALYLRYTIPVLFTAQETIQLPQHLAGKSFTFRELSEQERRAIFESSAGVPWKPELASFLEPFQTPFELHLAAECASNIQGTLTHTDLFTKYTQRIYRERTRDSQVIHRVLLEAAKRMGYTLVSYVTQRELRSIINGLLTKESDEIERLKDLVTCGLIESEGGGDRYSFRHEMLQHFFEAEALLLRDQDSLELSVALSRPRNRHLAKFVIGMLKTEPILKECLQALGNTAILKNSIRGYMGDLAKRLVTEDAYRILHAARQVSRDFSIRINQSLTEERKNPTIWDDSLEITESREWSAYDHAIMTMIGQSLQDGLFIDEVLAVTRVTDETLEAWIAQQAEETRTRWRSQLFHRVYVGTPPAPPAGSTQPFLPAKVFVAACDYDDFRHGVHTQANEKIVALYEDLTDKTPGELRVLSLLLERHDLPIIQRLPDLFDHCWNTGILNLRHEILFVVQQCNSRLKGSVREEIMNRLSSLFSKGSNDLLLNTTIVETASMYDLVESPISEDAVREEITQVLESTDEWSGLRAYGIYSMQGEGPSMAEYCSVIQGLPNNIRVQLLTKAALGVPSRPHPFYLVMILHELVELNDPEALPAFVRWAREEISDGLVPHESTESYVQALIGCALFMETPSKLKHMESAEHRIWQIYGEIIFWTHKPMLGADNISKRCTPLWEQLCTEFPFEAVDPLMFLYSANEPGDFKRPLEFFFLEFQNFIRQILAFGLRNHTRLTTLFSSRMDDDYRQKERVTFIIQTLGEIGTKETVKLLEPFVESSDFGADAIEAIRKLKSESSS